MRVIIILSILFCLHTIDNLKGQDTILNIEDLEIISSDSVALNNYYWTKCLIDMEDTIVILSDKKTVHNCIKKPVIKLIKINSINDDIGYRFYFNDLYIDGELFFPKDIDVFLLNCPNDTDSVLTTLIIDTIRISEFYFYLKVIEEIHSDTLNVLIEPQNQLFINIDSLKIGYKYNMHLKKMAKIKLEGNKLLRLLNNKFYVDDKLIFEHKDNTYLLKSIRLL